MKKSTKVTLTLMLSLSAAACDGAKTSSVRNHYASLEECKKDYPVSQCEDAQRVPYVNSYFHRNGFYGPLYYPHLGSSHANSLPKTTNSASTRVNVSRGGFGSIGRSLSVSS